MVRSLVRIEQVQEGAQVGPILMGWLGTTQAWLPPDLRRNKPSMQAGEKRDLCRELHVGEAAAGGAVLGAHEQVQEGARRDALAHVQRVLPPQRQRLRLPVLPVLLARRLPKRRQVFIRLCPLMHHNAFGVQAFGPYAARETISSTGMTICCTGGKQSSSRSNFTGIIRVECLQGFRV